MATTVTVASGRSFPAISGAGVAAPAAADTSCVQGERSRIARLEGPARVTFDTQTPQGAKAAASVAAVM